MKNLGFVIVNEIPEKFRNRLCSDYDLPTNYSGAQISTTGEILLHPKKAIYMIVEHIILEDHSEQINDIKGYMIIDKKESINELENAVENKLFWHFGVNEIEDNKLLISFLGDGYYYPEKLLEEFFDKICDYTIPLPYDRLSLFSDVDVLLFPETNTYDEITKKRYEDIPDEYKKYISEDKNKRKRLELSELKLN